MTKFLPINEIEATTAHTYDYKITIYYRNGENEKHSESFHRYTANELGRTVNDSRHHVEASDFAPVWVTPGTKATCVSVHCWKTGETFWFSVR